MARRLALTRDDIRPDDLLRLSDACRILFNDVLTPSSLRTEARKGNLEFTRIAGRDFVTKRALDEMRRRCAVQVEKPEKG